MTTIFVFSKFNLSNKAKENKLCDYYISSNVLYITFFLFYYTETDTLHIHILCVYFIRKDR